ncbi:MAG TPA: RagB/SusD family nutrient uptake outer membrane protein [Parasegetibacter sp.]|jgi:hypothetical protein
MSVSKYIYVFLLIGITTSSCKKGWLDVTSSSQIRSDEQFQSEAGARDALMGVYIGMTDPSMYSRDMTWNLIDLLAQQYATLPTLAQYYEVQRFNYQNTRARGYIDAMWHKTYGVIANINNALTEMEHNKNSYNAVSFSIMKGELLALRAFLHFDLMRIYGHGNIANRNDIAGKLAIPYVVTYSKIPTPQQSYSQTFALMHKDLNEAIELLKEDPIYENVSRPAGYYDEINRNGFFNNRQQRMNYYAAKAVQARIYLWQGGSENLAKARNLAEEVIAGTPARLLNTSPGNDKVLSQEHIFNLNVTAFTNIVDRFLNAEVATNYDALFLTAQRAQEIYETNIPTVGVVDFRYNSLLETQARGMVNVELHQSRNTLKNIMPLIKLPEMYYIAVEDYISTNLSKAITYLNTVRRSRGIIDDIPTSANADQVRSELNKEYQKEFVSEGQLFFFYKRTGQTQIPGIATPMTDAIYVLPYPDSEIEFGNRVQ